MSDTAPKSSGASGGSVPSQGGMRVAASTSRAPDSRAGSNVVDRRFPLSRADHNYAPIWDATGLFWNRRYRLVEPDLRYFRVHPPTGGPDAIAIPGEGLFV